MLSHKELIANATSYKRWQALDYISLAIANDISKETIVRNLKKEGYEENTKRKTIEQYLIDYGLEQSNKQFKFNARSVVYNNKIYKSISVFRREFHIGCGKFYKLVDDGIVSYA